MFNRMLNVFGIGGPSVDTVLDSPHAVPGQAITGQVRVQGGSSDAEIGQVVLSLVTQAEHEFFRLVVQQGVRVPAGQLVTIPFQLQVPWETPITAVGGAQLPGMNVGVRTELMIAGAPDQGDLDPILVSPLPSQNQVLDAFGQLGFTFRRADVEAGLIPGAPQETGFYQEIEFFPPAQFTGRISEVELTFVASPHELHVVLQADKRSGQGMFTASSGGDALGQMRLSHQEAQVTDWVSAINGWLSQVAQRGQVNPAFSGGHTPAFQNPAFSGGQAGYNPAFSQHGHADRRGFGRHGHDHDGYARGQQRGPGMGGPGMGGMLAAGAAGVAGGVVGGMVLGGVAEEFFGDDEG
jgi:sporulation-control protein